MIEGLIALGGVLFLAILSFAYYSGRLSQRLASTVCELDRVRDIVEDHKTSMDKRLDNDLKHIREELHSVGERISRIEGKINGLTRLESG